MCEVECKCNADERLESIKEKLQALLYYGVKMPYSITSIHRNKTIIRSIIDMLISAPKARVNAYYYDKKTMQYVATSIATDEEKHEIEDCNARRESVRIREQKELMEAKKNLRELRKELGEEEFDQLMKKALGD